MGRPLDGPPSETDAGPRQRPDVAEKLQRRKVLQEVVVKAALLKHLRGASTKYLVRAAIQERVEAYSKRAHLASTALSGLVKQCFDAVPTVEGTKDASQAQLPDFTDTTFFRQLMLGVEGADQVDEHVDAYYRAHPQLSAKLRSLGRHLGDRNIYSAGAKLCKTNFRNSFVVNFKQRLSKYLRCFQDRQEPKLSDDQRTWMHFSICGWDVRQLRPVVQLPAMLEAVAEHRRVLDLAAGKQVTAAWLGSSSNLHLLVRHAFLMCRYLEAVGRPAFNLVPISQRGAHFIDIDTSTLYGLLKQQRIVDCGWEAFKKLRDEQWQSVLKVDDLLGRKVDKHGRKIERSGKERTFTGTISTDGVSVCVHYQTPKLEQGPPPVAGASVQAKGPLADRAVECTVLGMDPGRANIYCFAAQQLDGSTRSWNLSRGHYYHSSGVYRARKQSETWQRGVQEELRQLSLVSTKGTGVADHEWFLLTNLQVLDRLWEEYLKPRWARQRLRLYGGKQRTFATFLGQVKAEATAFGGGRPVVVAYGAAKFAPGGKGEVAVPTSRAYKECRDRFETVLVDEFRTTKLSAADGSLLKQVQSRRSGAVVRGLLWHESASVSKFVDRDLNAALNIRTCAVLSRRPRWLCRVTGQQPLPRGNMGKTIKC